MAHSRIEGTFSAEHPRYALEAYAFSGEVWITTRSVYPASLTFGMSPEQARDMAAKLLKHAEEAEAQPAQVAA
ncbi:MAG: hypothetical protein ACLGIW_18440 [Gammaproteobacteria bacterium]